MKDLDKDEFLCEEYIGSILASETWTPHGSHINDWLADCDEVPLKFFGGDITTLKKDKEFLAFFNGWLSLRYDFAVKYLKEDLTKGLLVKRALYLSQEDIDKLSQSTYVDVGIFWTFSSNVVPYGAKDTEGKNLVVVTASLKEEDVNIKGTMCSRMDYVHGDYEMEIQTFPRAMVHVVSIEVML